MNITDVGHLTGDNEWDANTGEDRMEKWARKEWLTARDVADKYIKIYLDDLAFLWIDAGLEKWKHDIYMPRATDHIAEQIDMIQQLEKKWYTYIVDGDGVYMDTSKFKEYGVLLSDKHLAGLEEWVRVDLKGKKNPTDFALWKFNMTGKKRDMERESPWGIWFPGRHIECSAMSIKHLGKQFDIHTGGMEHIPVHHTNEIAQAECSCAAHPWVNYWVHYQWLMMNGKKIAKSDGNVAFLSDMREKGYTGEDVRMFYLQAHYRSFQDFTREALEAAQKGRKNLQKKIRNRISEIESAELDERVKKHLLDIEFTNTSVSYQDFLLWIKDRLASLKKTLKEFPIDENYLLEIDENFWLLYSEFDKVVSPLLDDLNTPELLGTLNWLDWKLEKLINLIDNSIFPRYHIKYFVLLFFKYFDDNIFKIGLFQEQETTTIPAAIQALAKSRREAKLAKDYSTADELRKQLHATGRDMLDGKDGFEIVPHN